MTVKKNDSRVFRPHDKLVRKGYGIRDNAHSFLTGYLPAVQLHFQTRADVHATGDRFFVVGIGAKQGRICHDTGGKNSERR